MPPCKCLGLVRAQKTMDIALCPSEADIPNIIMSTVVP